MMSMHTRSMEIQVWSTAIESVLILMLATGLVAIRVRRNDLADVIWGPGFLILSAASALMNFSCSELLFKQRFIYAIVLVAIWSLRLAMHIGRRAFSHDREDSRYLKMRESWGKGWIWRTLVYVFALQGCLMLVIASPLLQILGNADTPPDLFVGFGIFLWIIGFLLESIGDAQLRKFKSDHSNKGLLMTNGLWSWSRHPNYFGEVIQWWGIFFVAADVPWGWLTIISPLTITFLILKVSGVPMLEEQMRNRPGFAEYARRTSIFIPLPPRRT